MTILRVPVGNARTIKPTAAEPDPYLR